MTLAFFIALQTAPVLRPRPDFKPNEAVEAKIAGMMAREGRCDTETTGSEIVVCGRRDLNRYRMGVAVGPAAPEGLPMAETSLGGNVRGAIENERADVGGYPSNRVKVTIKIPF